MKSIARDYNLNNLKDRSDSRRYDLSNYSFTKISPFEDNPAKLISADLILELKIIAQQIGGDFGLQVVVGQPGKGSFFVFDPPSITLDPLHIISDPDNAKFIAGHEGAHRRFSPSPYTFGRSKKEIDELFQRPGFHATVNALEDCAVNDGLCRELPGLKKYTTSYYEKANKEGFQVSTPEIEAITMQIGRIPKFATALTEIMRDWHSWRKEGGYETSFENLAKEGRYLDGLDKSILRSLKNTRNASRKVISLMPKVGEKNEAIIRDLGKKRIEIADKTIYPEILRLYQEDLKQEAIRQSTSNDNKSGSSKGQFVEPSRATSREIDKAKEDLIDQKAGLSYEKCKKLNEQLRNEENALQHIEEQIKEIEQAVDTNSKNQIKDLKEELERTKLKAKELKKELEQNLPNGHSPDEINQEGGQDSLIDDFKKDLKKSLDKQNLDPLPFDKLSAKAQQELEDKFDQLSEETKEKLFEQAKKELAKFEHEFAKALESKTEAEKVESLYELQLKEDEAQIKSDEFDDKVKNQQQILENLEDTRKEDLNQFEIAFEHVASEVNKACNRLQRVLIPEASLKWKRDQMAGSKLNLQRAQQAEVDPKYLTKLFEKRLNPTRRTHAFEILVDTSGSMQGEKMLLAFQGSVFAAALCENLKVEFEVLEFNDRSSTKKSWTDSIRSTEVREKISKLSTANTSAGTNDAAAIDYAFKRISQKDSMYKFIFILTDAESSVSTELQKVLNKIERKSEESGEKVIVVHFGIGDSTVDKNGYYKYSFGNLEPEKFFSKFCEVIEAVILSPEEFFNRSK